MNLTVASSPHIRGNFRTNRIMLDVVLALLPALAVGIWHFGLRAALVALISVTSAVAAEWLFSTVTKTRNTAVDGSAMVTGLLLAMTLPHTVPYCVRQVPVRRPGPEYLQPRSGCQSADDARMARVPGPL